jgi:uncharacterized SAM-binding protein YcdF (DUF218 family)
MTGEQIVDLFLSPLVLGLLLVLALWLLRGRGARWLRRVCGTLIGFCIVLATPLAANTLIAIGEYRAPPASDCRAPLPTAIVVLAGGIRRETDDPADVGALSEASVQRTLAASAMVLRQPGTPLVISGGLDNGVVAESTRMAELSVMLGVPRASIATETTSLTTWENAQQVRATEPDLPARIWLVTSALHMPRSLIAFRAAGFTPCSAPVDYRAGTFRGVSDLVPRGSAINKSEAALHELAGELAYRWRAR